MVVREKSGPNLVVALVSRLDEGTSADVEDRLLAEIGATVTRLVLDLSAVEFLSSAGMRVLIVASKKVRANGGDMAFTGVGPSIRKVLEISGFIKMFRIVASPADAFAPN
ncbi:STAS domain-containing protein [Gemmata sp.]|uniref:STAS domain-containing protein n=1 Tax=Gemmata sp. TaxID=1914242 RepID=UPI003F72CA48